MNQQDINHNELLNTSVEIVDPNISQNIKNTDTDLDALLTSKDVCKLLKIDPHTLSTNRKIWSDILPPIRFKGSNLIRYRRADVMRLIEGDYTSSSSNNGD